MVSDANAGNNNVKLTVTVSVTVDSVITGGTANEFQYDILNIGGPKIEKSNTIHFKGPNPPPQDVVIDNAGYSTPGWDIDQGTVPPWLKFEPSAGTFDHHGQAKINVSVIPGELKGKSGQAKVTFEWNPAGPPSYNNVLTVNYTG